MPIKPTRGRMNLRLGSNSSYNVSTPEDGGHPTDEQQQQVPNPAAFPQHGGAPYVFTYLQYTSQYGNEEIEDTNKKKSSLPSLLRTCLCSPVFFTGLTLISLIAIIVLLPVNFNRDAKISVSPASSNYRLQAKPRMVKSDIEPVNINKLEEDTTESGDLEDDSEEIPSLPANVDHLFKQTLLHADPPLVATTSGKLSGIKQIVIKDGRPEKVNAFLGVPYAQTPERFRKPRDSQFEWLGVRKAVTQPLPCAQYRPTEIAGTWLPKNHNESEDCLYLNIWTPADKVDANLTTMVFIHGGAYFSGSIDLDLYQGDIMSAYGEVIIATIQYRLGAFGFLNAGISSAPGNMGLWDQATALRWIHRNIPLFGGSRDKIVLFGQSAGATSVGLHLMSPVSRDLVKRAIMQSGSPLFPMTYFKNSLKKSAEFAVSAGCASDIETDELSDPENTLDCLRNKPASELSQLHHEMVQHYKIPFFPHPDDDFLPGVLPHEAIWSEENIGPQREIMIGNTEQEGSFFLHFFLPQIYRAVGYPGNLTFDQIKDNIVSAYSFIPETQARVMTEFFLTKMAKSPVDEMVHAAFDVIGDSGFVCPSVEYSDIISDEYDKAVYHYWFTHRPSGTPWGKWMGSTHLDELPFVFGMPLRAYSYTKVNYTAEERDFSKQMINTWTTFAKTGKVPAQQGTEWPLYKKNEPAYITLSPKKAEVVQGSPHEKACSLWRVIQQSF